MIKPLKVNQKVLLICQEVIGTVVDVNNELNKVVIRAEKDGIKFDFIVTTEGFLPFSDTKMIEKIPFIVNETIIRSLNNYTIEIVTIEEIQVTKVNNTVDIVASVRPFNDKSISKVISLKSCQPLKHLQELFTDITESNKKLYEDNYLPGNNGGQTTQSEEE